MTQELILSVGKIVGSVGLLAGVLFAVTRLARRLGLQPETARKVIHVSLGLYCLTFPAIFAATWEVAATCALAAGLFALARGRLRSAIGEGLHAVGRVSYGELLFAVSVVLLFALKDGHFVSHLRGQAVPPAVLYVLPLLILTLCDAASALVGSSYGRATFKVEEGVKSWEGVVVFVVTAWLLSMIFLLLITDLSRADVIALALITALFGALFEAASWRGLDNLFIPLGLYFVLANLLARGTGTLFAISAAFAVALVVVVAVGRRRGFDAHVLATGVTLFFCIAIFSGLESILTPLGAFLTYAVAVRLGKAERPAHDSLSMLLTIVAVALVFFLVSDLAQLNTIFGFNLAFACLAVAIAAYFTARPLVIAGVVLGAWALMSVRTLWIAGIDQQTLRFQVGAIGALALAGLIAGLARGAMSRRPWLSLGGLSTVLGVGVLLAAPT